MPSPWRPPGLAQFQELGVEFNVDGQVLQETSEAWTPCHRIIASEYASENLFDRLVLDRPYPEQANEADTLRDIADLTNPHVLAEHGQIELIPAEDRTYVRGAGLIMAAFACPSPPSRFSDGSEGTYYAARSLDTAIAETRYHADQYMLGSGPCVTEKTVIEADLNGTFLDVRSGLPAPPDVYNLDDYRAGQTLGRIVRHLRGFGILYDSVRHDGGECVAVMRPPVLRDAVPVRTLQYVWDGTHITAVR